MISRRRILGWVGSAALALPGTRAAAKARRATFRHGVASGDPGAHSMVLWTRATPDGDGDVDIPLRWHIAATQDGAASRFGDVIARAARDFTAKVDAGGLEQGHDYWFWFETPGGTRSPKGRFRTLPIGSTADAVMAVVSCQIYQAGLFNAYDAIAGLDRLDVVLHLGDYIYESGADGTGAETARTLGRVHEPAHETITLADYRLRHAQMKRDPDLQAAHARAAFVCVWDDHDIANDDWRGGAEGHDPATEGSWAARKAAAMRAYFEWMPVREPGRGKTWETIERRFDFGDLATLVMLETRLRARTKQLIAGGAKTPADYAALIAERAQPNRELLGASQLGWVERSLAASVRAGKPWQVIGNQVVMARVVGPDPERQPGGAPFAAMLAKLPERWQSRLSRMIAAYRAGLPFDLDSWDGYPSARERLYAAFRRAGSHPIVLSGDSHAAWANDLHDGAGRLVAAEFGTTAITSPSYGSLLPGVGGLIADANAEVAFCDQDNKGYLLLRLTHDEAAADFVTVSTILAKPYERRIVRRFRCAATLPRLPIAG